MLALLIPIAVAAVWPGELWDESLGFTTIVIGEWVPTLTVPTGLALIAGLGAVIVAPVLGSWDSGARDNGMTIRIVSSLSMSVLVLSAVGSWMGIWGADRTYVFVGDTSEHGCQVIGAGRVGFHNGSLAFGVLRPGEHRVEWVATNIGSDRTVSRILDDAAVTWAGDLATIEFDRFDDVAIRCVDD